MTYDTFHEGAERTYLVRSNDKFSDSGISRRLPYPLGRYLKEHYPEIEDYASFDHNECYAVSNNKLQRYQQASADSSFMRMMGIRIVKGNIAFPVTYVIVKQWMEGYNRADGDKCVDIHRHLCRGGGSHCAHHRLACMAHGEREPGGCSER